MSRLSVWGFRAGAALAIAASALSSFGGGMASHALFVDTYEDAGTVAVRDCRTSAFTAGVEDAGLAFRLSLGGRSGAIVDTDGREWHAAGEPDRFRRGVLFCGGDGGMRLPAAALSGVAPVPAQGTVAVWVKSPSHGKVLDIRGHAGSLSLGVGPDGGVTAVSAPAEARPAQAEPAQTEPAQAGVVPSPGWTLSGGSVASAGWHLVAVAFDAGATHLSIDGKRVGTAPAAPAPAGFEGTWTLGSVEGGWAGTLDELVVLTTAGADLEALTTAVDRAA